VLQRGVRLAISDHAQEPHAVGFSLQFLTQSRVILLENAKKEYEILLHKVLEQEQQGKTNTQEQQLLRSIQQKVEFLKANPFYGDNIPKKLIPKKFNVQNLWRVELSQFWRMLYTIRGDEIEIICFILEIVDHQAYDKRFGYKKK
jgi:Txe/YoeB family toxin of Txe-Axe toxin-antitoxin module